MKTIKNAGSIALFGLVLIILVNLYYVLVNFHMVHSLEHGGKIMGLLAFVGYLALLPFFLNFRKK